MTIDDLLNHLFKSPKVLMVGNGHANAQLECLMHKSYDCQIEHSLHRVSKDVDLVIVSQAESQHVVRELKQHNVKAPVVMLSDKPPEHLPDVPVTFMPMPKTEGEVSRMFDLFKIKARPADFLSNCATAA